MTTPMFTLREHGGVGPAEIHSVVAVMDAGLKFWRRGEELNRRMKGLLAFCLYAWLPRLGFMPLG